MSIPVVEGKTMRFSSSVPDRGQQPLAVFPTLLLCSIE